MVIVWSSLKCGIGKYWWKSRLVIRFIWRDDLRSYVDDFIFDSDRIDERGFGL